MVLNLLGSRTDKKQLGEQVILNLILRTDNGERIGYTLVTDGNNGFLIRGKTDGLEDVVANFHGEEIGNMLASVGQEPYHAHINFPEGGYIAEFVPVEKGRYRVVNFDDFLLDFALRKIADGRLGDAVKRDLVAQYSYKRIHGN